LLLRYSGNSGRLLAGAGKKLLYNEELIGLVAANKIGEGEFFATGGMKQAVSDPKRLRIAVDLTPMLRGGANGGVKPAILEFIRALQGLQDPGFDFFFITAGSSDHEVRAIATDRDETIHLGSAQAQRILRPGPFERKRIDLLYAPFGMVRFPYIGVPIVSMVVDLLHRDYPHSLPAAERQFRESYFAKMVLSADRFQVISDYTGERLAHHYGVPVKRIFRTYLPIQDRLKPPANVIGPANRFFFYPANFWPHKNHEILLIAYQIYRYQAGSTAWDLVLTGSDDPRRPVLQDLAKKLGIERHVFFKGHVEERELAQLFSTASGMTFPSLHEGFGIPLLEAMQLGVPVLTSAAGSLREVVSQAGLLVNPRKPVELAAAMQKLASSEELQEDLRRRGFERAKCFSFQTEVMRLADTFIQTTSLAKKWTWDARLRRRFALLQSYSLVCSRTAADSIYRFLRDRV
jgi:glycosyltransferase involved in cell wall biosynthesis